MMGDFEVSPFADAEALARAAATAWLQEITSANHAGATHCVALSGGRIAGRLFSEVAEQAKAGGVSFRAVQFFWADERCVPSEDADSNFRLACDKLLVPLQIPDTQVHRIRGEAAPESAAAEAEAEICRIAPLDAVGQPVLNLVLLGMGENGHVASLFPGEPETVMASKAVYRAVIADKPPPRRITLGYAAIAAARHAWVLASGPGKETALTESLSQGGQTPLARVLKLRRNTRVFSDIQRR